MPAFTFEKISPPVHREPITPVLEKPHGVLSQMIGRLAGKPAKPCPREEYRAASRDEKSAE